MADYKERYEEELEIPTSNPFLGMNIKQLRIEKRINTKNFSEMLEVDELTLKNWESAKEIPSFEQIAKIAKILKISHYDIMTRNIFEERNQATKKIKTSKERSNYNWYFGDKRRIILYLIYLISIPCLFLLSLLFIPLFKVSYEESLLYLLVGDNVKYIFSYAICSIVSGVIIVIRFLTLINYRFQLWHLLWISFLSVLTFIIGIIGTVPYYIYIIVILIIKKGKNHR